MSILEEERMARILYQTAVQLVNGRWMRDIELPDHEAWYFQHRPVLVVRGLAAAAERMNSNRAIRRLHPRAVRPTVGTPALLHVVVFDRAAIGRRQLVDGCITDNMAGDLWYSLWRKDGGLIAV